jgi:hypothetical protein
VARPAPLLTTDKTSLKLELVLMDCSRRLERCTVSTHSPKTTEVSCAKRVAVHDATQGAGMSRRKAA